MNDQDLTKTDYDPDRSLVLIEGLSHFLTNFLQNLASCQTSLKSDNLYVDFSVVCECGTPCEKIYVLAALIMSNSGCF
jgi:hypothetical protein